VIISNVYAADSRTPDFKYPSCPHVRGFTFVMGSQIVVKNHRLAISLKSFSRGNLQMRCPGRCLALQPESIFLPHYRSSRRFRRSKCCSTHQKNLRDLASDEMALSDSKKLATLCRSPPDVFGPVLCQHQIILQVMIGLCDQSTFTIETEIISIHEASMSF
jgi:hypothetical protein